MDPRDAVAEAAARLSRAAGDCAVSLGRQLAQRLPPPLRMGSEAAPRAGHTDATPSASCSHVARLQDSFQDPHPHATSSFVARPQNPFQELVTSVAKLQGEAMAHLGRIPAEVVLQIQANIQGSHNAEHRDLGRMRSGNPLAAIRHASPPPVRRHREPGKTEAPGGTEYEAKQSQEGSEGSEAHPKSLSPVRIPKRRTRQAANGKGRGDDGRTGRAKVKGKGRKEGGEGEDEEEGTGARNESVEEFLASVRDEPHIVRLQPWRDSPRYSSPPGPDSYPRHTLVGPEGVMRGMRGGGGGVAASAMAEELITLGLRDTDGTAAQTGAQTGGGGFWSFLPWNRGTQRGGVGEEPRGLGRPAMPAGDGRPAGAELAESVERMPEGAPAVFGQKLHGPVTKEELGRATWTLLHSLAAQYPEKPSRQLQRDVRTFIGLLPSVYPCRICGEHFKEVLKSNPPEVGSKAELEQYMCRIHNVVNRSLNKPQFPCKRVAARWGSLECDDKACEL